MSNLLPTHLLALWVYCSNNVGYNLHFYQVRRAYPKSLSPQDLLVYLACRLQEQLQSSGKSAKCGSHQRVIYGIPRS